MAAHEVLHPKQFLYHEAPAQSRESIRSEGLRPGKAWTLGHGEHAKTVPAGVYLSPHGYSEYGSSMHDASAFGFDRWRANVANLPVHPDEFGSTGSLYTPEHIHPSRLQLVKKGDPDWEKRSAEDW